MSTATERWRRTSEICRKCGGLVDAVWAPALAGVALPVVLKRCRYCRWAEPLDTAAGGEHWHRREEACLVINASVCRRLASRPPVHCKGTLGSCSHERVGRLGEPHW